MITPAWPSWVLTTYADDSSVLEALQAGARSYLTKNADCTDIARALEAAAGGLTVFDPRARDAARRRVRAPGIRARRLPGCPT
jgi:DNA-binding NarL/FixJ family response regulator